MAKNVLKEGALSEADLDRLTEFLKQCDGGQAMRLEEVDGFFAALIAGPELVPPSEYLPEVFGGEMSETCKFETLDHAQDILGLLMRHSNAIATALNKGDVYVPILAEDENGICGGNTWARGFMRGVNMRHDQWAELINDEEHSGLMIPVLMLYHEHDKDPELRPGPISPAMRDEVIVGMAAGIVRAYRYFRSNERKPIAPLRIDRPRPKIGRNDPCPCGSGKKYKRCCGNALIN